MNLLRRKLAVATLPTHIKNIDVFYIVWHRNDSEFFLCDALKDGAELRWSVFPESGIKFQTGEEALSFCNEINTRKRGPGIIELKIIVESVDDEDTLWSI
jgi:hypothetical protein